MPCDLLLLRGPCIVDESMLTGESVPVMKVWHGVFTPFFNRDLNSFSKQEAVEALDEDDQFTVETHGKLHVLYGGTKVVQHTPPPKSSPGLKGQNFICVN